MTGVPTASAQASDPRPAPAAEAAPNSVRRGRLVWGACLVLAACGLFIGYLHLARTTTINSDGAAVALQAHDMLHGNWLLSGWWTADVSFYPTELLEYVLVEAVLGINPDVVHVCAALTYTLIVLIAALLARGRSRGPEGVLRAIIAGTILVAPAAGQPAHVLLLSPNHTGTAVPILATLLFLDRAPTARWVPPVILVLLTWIQVADQLALVAAAAPVVLIGAARLARGRFGEGSRWYDGGLVIAGLASIGLARLVLVIIHAAGGFYQPPLTGGHRGLLASPGAIPAQIRLLGDSVRILFSVYGAAGHGWFAAVTFAVHWALLAGAVLGLLLGIARFRGLDRVTQVLVAGVAAVLLAGTFGTFQNNIADAHQVAVLLPMSAALAGRMIPVRRLVGAGRPAALARVALAVTLCWLTAALGYAATDGGAVPSNQQLAGWLLSRNLTSGLASYWESGSVSLDSGDRVRIATVLATSTGLAPYQWESVASWYNPRVSHANFVITGQDPAAGLVVPESQLTAWFGRPAQILHFEQYTITVWNENLLTHLAP